jgi:CHAD domain-containing protein
MTKAADELSSRLAAIRTPRDHEAIHEARIAAKRLRYLLEPVVASVPGVRGVVKDLRMLQDVAGALHDAHVFSRVLADGLGAHVPRASSLARRSLARQLVERSRVEYARLEQDWLGEAAARFRARVLRIARRCEREGRPTVRNMRARRRK